MLPFFVFFYNQVLAGVVIIHTEEDRIEAHLCLVLDACQQNYLETFEMDI